MDHPPPPSNDDDWATFWLQYLASCSPQELTTIARQDVVLASYAHVGTAKSGLEAAGLTRHCYERWKSQDIHHFRERLRMAHETHADQMEEVMHERLIDPQGNKGSDVLLMFDLKGLRPDKWRELPVIIASDTSREIQEKLIRMVSEGMKRRAASITVSAETPDARVQRMLGPGTPEETRGS